MQNEGTPRYWRVKAVAERFDVSPSTVYRAIEAGELAAVRIGGSVRVPAEAVEAFEQAAADTAAVSAVSVSAGTEAGA